MSLRRRNEAVYDPSDRNEGDEEVRPRAHAICQRSYKRRPPVYGFKDKPVREAEADKEQQRLHRNKQLMRPHCAIPLLVDCPLSSITQTHPLSTESRAFLEVWCVEEPFIDEPI